MLFQLENINQAAGRFFCSTPLSQSSVNSTLIQDTDVEGDTTESYSEYEDKTANGVPQFPSEPGNSVPKTRSAAQQSCSGEAPVQESLVPAAVSTASTCSSSVQPTPSTSGEASGGKAKQLIAKIKQRLNEKQSVISKKATGELTFSKQSSAMCTQINTTQESRSSTSIASCSAIKVVSGMSASFYVDNLLEALSF